MELYAKRISLIGSENAFKIGPHIQGLERGGNRVIKMNLGEPDFDAPEFIKTELKRQIDLNNTHYTDPQGILSFRQTIAEQVARTRGIAVTPQQVVVFPGAKPPIGFAQQVYLDPGDEVIYPSPGFPIYESFIRYFGGVPRPLLLQEDKGFSFDGADLARLLSPKTKLIFLNFPSNPTGGVASREQIADIATVIRSRCDDSVRVYSDEIYEAILFDDHRSHSIASCEGMQQRTIIVSGHSKTFAWTGGRIGYAVLPSPQEADVFKNLNINYFSCVPPYNQEAARVAMAHPAMPEAVGGMVAAFKKRRDAVVARLNQIEGITCQLPKGAFYVFPNIAAACDRLGVLKAYAALDPQVKAATSPSTIFQMFLLYEYRVACMDRPSFGRIGAENQHFLRLSIATSLEDLLEGLERLAAAVQDRKGLAHFMTHRREHYA